MEEIAWIIRTKDINRPAAFASMDKAGDAKDREVEIVPAD
jgi:hypothetical protein